MILSNVLVKISEGERCQSVIILILILRFMVPLIIRINSYTDIEYCSVKVVISFKLFVQETADYAADIYVGSIQ